MSGNRNVMQHPSYLLPFRKAAAVFRAVFLFFSVFLLTGCGGRKEKENDAGAASWKEKGFALEGEIMQEQALWVERYVPWSHDGLPYGEETDVLLKDSVCLGNRAYNLYGVYDITNRDAAGRAALSKLVLDCYDADGMERSLREISLEELGMEDPFERVGKMDALDGTVLAFQIYGHEVEDSLYRPVSEKIQALGGKEEGFAADVMEVWLEKGVMPTQSEGAFTVNWICDGTGNSYAVGMDGNSLYVLDSEGGLLAEYLSDPGDLIVSSMKTEDGEPVFLIQGEDGKKKELIWLDTQSGQFRELADLGEEQVTRLYGMQDGFVYYENPDGIVRWDVASGARQLVLDFAQNGVSVKSCETMLLFCSGKPPVLRIYNLSEDGSEEEDWLAVLSEEPSQGTDTVHIACLVEAGKRIENAAALAGRRDRNCLYMLENSGNISLEDYRDRIFAELAAGKGPDILYVTREDARLLQEKGLTADLETLVSEETLDRLMPGAVLLGTADGTFIGLPAGLQARSLLVGRDVFDGESWTLEEVAALIHSGRLEPRMLSNSRSGYFSSFATIITLIGYSLEDSFLIDWENRVCHFDDERFVGLLEDVGREHASDEVPTDKRTVNGGGSQMVDVSLYSVESGSFLGCRGAEGSHYIGFPTEGASGSFLDTDGLLVVKKDPVNPEAVAGFLECLLESENQFLYDPFSLYNLPVVYFPTDEIQYDDTDGSAWWNGEELLVFEDGTTSLHEANALLERCVPAPLVYSDLMDIIREELNAYFEEEDRTVQDTVDKINNRVQLYLDEG